MVGNMHLHTKDQRPRSKKSTCIVVDGAAFSQ